MNSRELALQWFDQVWNKKDRGAILWLLDESGVGETEGGSITGPAQFAELVFDALLGARSELTVRVQGVTAEGLHPILI